MIKVNDNIGSQQQINTSPQTGFVSISNKTVTQTKSSFGKKVKDFFNKTRSFFNHLFKSKKVKLNQSQQTITSTKTKNVPQETKNQKDCLSNKSIETSNRNTSSETTSLSSIFISPNIDFDNLKVGISGTEFQQIWNSPRTLAGTGDTAKLYHTKNDDGKEYILKVYDDEKTFIKCKDNLTLFDGISNLSHQSFKEDFATPLGCVNKTEEGKIVVVFERTSGESFSNFLYEKDDKGLITQDKPITKENAPQFGRILTEVTRTIASAQDQGFFGEINPNNLMIETHNEMVNGQEQKTITVQLVNQIFSHNYTNVIRSGFEREEKSKEAYYMYDVIVKDRIVFHNTYSIGVMIAETFWGEAYRVQREQQENEDFNYTNYKRNEIPSNFYSKDQAEFLHALCSECLFGPQTMRLTMKQVTELLNIFTNSLENGNGEILTYSKAKRMVVEKYPIDFPHSVKNMVFSSDPVVQEKGERHIKFFAGQDARLKDTALYGLCLAKSEVRNIEGFSKKLKDENINQKTRRLYQNKLKFNKGLLRDWASEHYKAFQDLKDFVYIVGNEPQGSQSIPVDQDVFNLIMEAVDVEDLTPLSELEKDIIPALKKGEIPKGSSCRNDDPLFYTPETGLHIILDMYKGFKGGDKKGDFFELLESETFSWNRSYLNVANIEDLKGLVYIKGKRPTDKQIYPVPKQVYNAIQKMEYISNK